MKFRKPRPVNSADANLLSGQLRTARDLIQQRGYASGLSHLNSVLSSTGGEGAQGQVLGLTADSQFMQGKYEDAYSIYSQAEVLVEDQPRGWLRPVMGKVRSLLKLGNTTDALNAALAAVSKASLLESNYPPGGSGIVNPRPWPAAVIGTRLAGAFLWEGEVTSAQTLLAQVFLIKPQGTVAARLYLAKLALRAGDAAGAAAQAKQALLQGDCGAKTLGGWTIFIDAAKAAGLESYDPVLVSTLAGASLGVRARAKVLIARALRAHRDTRWQNVAQTFLSSSLATANDRAAAEMRKMLASTMPTLIGGTTPAQQQTAAQALLATPSLSPLEWLSAAKKSVQASFASNQLVAIEAWILQGVSKYGLPMQMRLTHALAQVAEKHGQFALAQQWFELNTDSEILPGTIWGKSTWALARLAEKQGQFSQAAQRYLAYSQVQEMPSRLRLYAQIGWARNLAKAGQPELILPAQQAFLDTVNQIDDYELVLDVARQLTSAPSELNALAQQICQRGETLANALLDTTDHPAVVLQILFKLARRQNDFGRHEAIVAKWEQLTLENKNWLWTSKGIWWEYLALVFRAYLKTDQASKATALATAYLSDPATPPDGLAVLGIVYGLHQIASQQFTFGMARFDQALTSSPTHPMCAYAHYWKGLAAWKQGDATGATQRAVLIQAAIGNTPGLSWQKDLDQRAILLSAGLQTNLVNTGATAYSAAEFTATLQAMQADLVKIV